MACRSRGEGRGAASRLDGASRAPRHHALLGEWDRHRHQGLTGINELGESSARAPPRREPQVRLATRCPPAPIREPAPPRRAHHEPGAVRHHPGLLRLAGPGRDRVRSGTGRPVRDPRGGQHRRPVAGGQRRIRGRPVRHPARGGARPLAMRRDLATLEELRRPRDQSRNSGPSWTACVLRSKGCSRPTIGPMRRSGAAGGSGQHPRVGEPPTAWLGAARAADPWRWVAGRRRGVLLETGEVDFFYD